MATLVAGSAMISCLGDGPTTFAALLSGRSGVGPLPADDAARLNVGHAYGIPGHDRRQPFHASLWLARCVETAVAQACVVLGRPALGGQVVALVGTGLRELRTVELWDQDDRSPAGRDLLDRLHFGPAVREACPADEVLTLANACSAGGYALAVAEDLLAVGAADAVVVGGVDGMTDSMLAMIGRVADPPARRVRPFDVHRQGVLLGEGAAAAILVRDGTVPRPLARLLSTGISCDARHETAPDARGIERAMVDAHRRAGTSPGDVAAVMAHGTGTELNDRTEATVLAGFFGDTDPPPLVTAIKGATGHTSGASPLMSLDIALHALQAGIVPPVVGLAEVLGEGRQLRFAVEGPAPLDDGLIQVDAFGFGGVNAVTLVAPP